MEWKGWGDNGGKGDGRTKRQCMGSWNATKGEEVIRRNRQTSKKALPPVPKHAWHISQHQKSKESTQGREGRRAGHARSEQCAHTFHIHTPHTSYDTRQAGRQTERMKAREQQKAHGSFLVSHSFIVQPVLFWLLPFSLITLTQALINPNPPISTSTLRRSIGG